MLGFGISARELRNARRSVVWSDPRVVLPLKNTPKKYFLSISNKKDSKRVPVIRICDISGNAIYSLQRASSYFTTWIMRDIITNETVATIYPSSTSAYFELGDINRILYTSRNSGRYREYKEDHNGVLSSYRWYSQSYHLERVSIETNTEEGHNNEISASPQIVGTCRCLQTKPIAFEFSLDGQGVNIVSGLASGFISIITEWRKMKLHKSQATIDLERDEAISKFKRLATLNWSATPPRYQRVQSECASEDLPASISVVQNRVLVTNIDNERLSRTTQDPQVVSEGQCTSLSPVMESIPIRTSQNNQLTNVPNLIDLTEEQIEEQPKKYKIKRNTGFDKFQLPSNSISGPSSSLQQGIIRSPKLRPMSNPYTPVITSRTYPHLEGKSAVIFPKMISRSVTDDP